MRVAANYYLNKTKNKNADHLRPLMLYKILPAKYIEEWTVSVIDEIQLPLNFTFCVIAIWKLVNFDKN